MLKNVKQEKHRHHSAQSRSLEQIFLLRRLHVPHQPRIIDTLYRAKLPHCHGFLFPHVSTLLTAKRSAFPRSAVSRFSTAGSFALLLHWAAQRVSSESSASLACPLRETLLSRSGLPSSGTSTSRTAPLGSLWRGPEEETSRGPPPLPLPPSPTPQTFFLRGRGSSFPLPPRSPPHTLPCSPALLHDR